MPPAGLEPTISAGERPQTYALGRAATWTGDEVIYRLEFVATSGIVSLLNQRLFFAVHLDSIYILAGSLTALSVTHET